MHQNQKVSKKPDKPQKFEVFKRAANPAQNEQFRKIGENYLKINDKNAQK